MDFVRTVVKDWSPTKRVRVLKLLGDDPHAAADQMINSLRFLNDPPPLSDIAAYLEGLLIDHPSPLAQITTSLACGEELVWKICNDVWKSAHASFDSVPRYGAWQHTYCEGKLNVCTFGSHTTPSLLWSALDCPSEMSQTYAEDIFTQCQNRKHLVVVLGASGVGKTRTILEWGMQTNCMILMGQGEWTAGGYSGSRDVLAVARYMLELFGDTMPITNTTSLSGCVAALLFTRFFLWMKCKEGRPEITSYDWMCLQLEYGRLGITDVFEEMTVALMQKFILKDDNIHWDDVSKMFWTMIDQLQRKLHWDGFIAIDECQEINHYLSNRFASVTLGEGKRSLLIPFLVEVSKCSKTSAIVVSGTGVSLLELKQVFQSGSVKQRLEYSEVLDFKGFDDERVMTRYANKFVETSDLDMYKIFCIYKGRYRFFVTALERYMSAECKGGTRFFLDFASALCSLSGVELRLFRSVRDDVLKIFKRIDPKQIGFVMDLVLGYYFGGITDVHFFDTVAFQMVEYGIGRLSVMSNEDDVTLYNGKLPFEGESDGFACVKIDEPIVQKALLNFLKQDSTQFGRYCTGRYVSSARKSDSKIGEDYELYASTSLGNFFDGRAPIDMLPVDIEQEVENVYKEQVDLVQSDDPVLACLVKDVSAEYRLLNWMDAIESNASFSTYLHTGLDNDCGPDVIFMLYVPSMGKFLPVLCQMKTGQEVNQRDALSSLDIDSLYMHNRTKVIHDARDREGVKRLKSWCTTGYIQLVVTTPMTDLFGSIEKNYNVKRTNPLRGIKDQSSLTMPCVKPLYGIVDKSNCHLFLDEWLRTAIKHLKKDTRKRRR